MRKTSKKLVGFMLAASLFVSSIHPGAATSASEFTAGPLQGSENLQISYISSQPPHLKDSNSSPIISPGTWKKIRKGAIILCIGMAVGGWGIYIVIGYANQSPGQNSTYAKSQYYKEHPGLVYPDAGAVSFMNSKEYPALVSFMNSLMERASEIPSEGEYPTFRVTRVRFTKDKFEDVDFPINDPTDCMCALMSISKELGAVIKEDLNSSSKQASGQGVLASFIGELPKETSELLRLALKVDAASFVIVLLSALMVDSTAIYFKIKGALPKEISALCSAFNFSYDFLVLALTGQTVPVIRAEFRSSESRSVVLKHFVSILRKVVPKD